VSDGGGGARLFVAARLARLFVPLAVWLAVGRLALIGILLVFVPVSHLPVVLLADVLVAGARWSPAGRLSAQPFEFPAAPAARAPAVRVAHHETARLHASLSHQAGICALVQLVWRRR
jgi:hypothetical protein